MPIGVFYELISYLQIGQGSRCRQTTLHYGDFSQRFTLKNNANKLL